LASKNKNKNKKNVSLKIRSLKSKKEECTKLVLMISNYYMFKMNMSENYEDVINNCIPSICIADTYRAVLEMNMD
jgi:hypothetical protein